MPSSACPFSAAADFLEDPSNSGTSGCNEGKHGDRAQTQSRDVQVLDVEVKQASSQANTRMRSFGAMVVVLRDDASRLEKEPERKQLSPVGHCVLVR